MRALSVLLVMGLFAYAQKSAPYPPPGKLVNLGGYRVHVNCTGEGSPTVMIVGGGFSFDWSLVQPEIAKTTRVCTYDASGTAWSDPGPGRGCPAWVKEVHELLGKAQTKGPYVLVGFSAGAIVARLYASTYPGEVAGMAIVDHAFLPELVKNVPPAGATRDPGGVDTPPAILSMTPVIISHEDEPGFGNLSKQAQELDRWANSLNPDLPTEETAKQCLSAAEAMQTRPDPLEEMPLVVISTSNDAAGYAELQSHLLALSRNSRQLMATKSFHSVEISQPDVVIEGIRRVIIAVRTHASLKDAP